MSRRLTLTVWLGALLVLCWFPGAASADAPLAWTSPAQIDQPQPPGGTPAALNGISCPTTSLCIGVDDKGNVVVSTNPGDASPAWSIVHVDEGNLQEVSCTTNGGTLCVAVDDVGNVVTSTNPTGGAAAWHVASIDGTILTGISCPSTSLCVAGDFAGQVFTSTNPIGGSAAWTNQGLISNAGFPQQLAISCPAASRCFASALDGRVFTTTDPTGGWSLAATDTGISPNLIDISCPSTSFCAAAEENGGGVFTSSDPTGGAANWHYNVVNAGTAGDLHHFEGISCASAALCVATDEHGNAVTSSAPDSAAWTVRAIGGGFLSDASCPTTTFCVVVGNNGQAITSIAPDSASWGPETRVDSYNSFGGASCPSGSLCVASDSNGNILTSTTPDSGPWQRVTVDPTNSINDVSCASTTLCVAVDGSQVWISTNPTGGAAAWQSKVVDSPNFLRTIFCTSNGGMLCVAADTSGNLLASTDPQNGATSTWTSTAVDAINPIDNVSCPSAALCVATAMNTSSFKSFAWVSTHPGDSTPGWTRSTNEISPTAIGDLSCPSVNLCVAGDFAAKVTHTITPANPNSWEPPLNLQALGTTGYLSTACPTASLCLLGDARGTVVTTTNPTTASASDWTPTHVDAMRNVMALSCASNSLCLAADDVGFALTGSQHTLTVTTPGSGQGRVTGSGIDCGNGHTDCTETYPGGTGVSLTATAASGSTFSGFGGACSGTSCSLTMSADRTISANFALQRTLTVSTSGTGSGTVTGPGIDCGGPGHADCSETYTEGTNVNLTTTADAGSTFTGFGGDCSGTTCSLTMSGNHAVSGTFDTIPPPVRALTVSTSGTGSGNVTGPGIDCGGAGHTDCSETYTDGTNVTLDAGAASGSTFGGWGADCSGTGACSLTMSADRSVSATFVANQPPPPPNTKIKKAIIDQANDSATFKFSFTGGLKAKAAQGFQCALVKKKHTKPRFKGCKSPKSYRHLKPRRYVFEVRAFTAAGRDPTPAKRKFRIKP